eukprot:2635877-Prymnesium_polylepis.1
MCAACSDCPSSRRHIGTPLAGRMRVADAVGLPRRPARRMPCSMSTWDEGHPQKTTCERRAEPSASITWAWGCGRCLAVGLRLRLRLG